MKPSDTQPYGKVIKRRDFLRISGVAALGLALSCRPMSDTDLQHVEQRQPYNILFVYADQMHGFALGCMGNTGIKTPNLDRLAAEGVLFRNTYSCYPVCTPFRGILMTGRYASQTGVFENNQPLPQNEKTIASALNDGGYHTSYIGKWHLGATGNVAVPKELRGGFTDFIGYQCYNDFLNNVWFFDENGNKTEYKKHRTDATTDIAIERLDKIKDKKFAMFVSYQNPHYPEQPSKEYEDMYAGMKIPRRPNAADVDPYTRTGSPKSDPNTDPVNKKYGNNLDEYIRLYNAMVTQLDHNVGRLMDRLKQLGIADKTVVIFTSDHGDMQGSHGLKNKNTFYEESTRIPLIVRVPGGRKGAASDELVSCIDFFPTILDYAGLPTGPFAEGTSFSPSTCGKEQHLNGEVFSEGGDIENKVLPPSKKWIMIRDGNHKLVVSKDGLTPTHLFDLSKDPYEMKNLLEEKDNNEAKAICERLHRKLAAWYEDITKRKKR